MTKIKKEYIEKLILDAKIALKKCETIHAVESLRIKFLGKHGYIHQMIKIMRDIPPQDRPQIGLLVNKAKEHIQISIIKRKQILKSICHANLISEKIDVSLPGRNIEKGSLHPITLTIAKIEKFFIRLGFINVSGPEIENEYYNFSALNIPFHHPVRTEYDTFWFDPIRLLRTQTSNVQIRTLINKKPPIRIISSGRVYRSDYDSTHTPMFHQMEGMMIDKNINFSHLKEIINNFLKNYFDGFNDLEMRFRPSYFPFTEPSAEIDIKWKSKHWLEVLGCGMIHPNIFYNTNIDPEQYTGFAFGLGIERLAMIRYGINDVRLFFQNDLRFLKQFK
ncbi:phenylalanine--tRNA ligase subunit alpha [Candidatus Schneideria nysicola]|uniref:phenylalanine--tRNA ligase subunit alpha n=1 Tax=Candidatus Schneideria nysicola TaxID=1081631 RepID=UPI001CAA4326|nr:phenylalanine--tRNA ligase subunit alpha [Candidatus Schneideria nysicola]UAJ66264.1 phenylalanine--tRNA ligase subunit alpha [Candidatus Schneideria nysicola]